MEQNASVALGVLAFAFMQNARPAKSAVLLEALDLLEPGQPATLQALAAAQVRSGRHAQALDTLDRLALAGGAGPVFHLLRSQALLALGRPEEAHAAMQAFIRSREPAPSAPSPGQPVD